MNPAVQLAYHQAAMLQPPGLEHDPMHTTQILLGDSAGQGRAISKLSPFNESFLMGRRLASDCV